MKTFICSLCLGLIWGAAAISHGATIPSINVTVLESSGKTVFKGPTNAKGVFATGALKPGSYVVQFNSKTAPKEARYALVAAAGKEKVVANGIPGGKLIAGVAVTIKVGPGLNLSGQITAEDKNSAPIGRNGQLMVWISKRTGSNLSGHWAESDSAEAKEVMTSKSFSVKNMQNAQNQGVDPMNMNETAGAAKMNNSGMMNPATGSR